MICRKRKIMINKIEVFDDEMIHSENQVPRIFAISSINKTNTIEGVPTDNAEMLTSREEFYTNKVDCNQVTEEPND